MKKFTALSLVLVASFGASSHAECVYERFSVGSGTTLQTYRGEDGAQNCAQTRGYCDSDTRYQSSLQGCKRPEDELFRASSRFELWHRGGFIQSFSSTRYFTDREWAERDAHAYAYLACTEEQSRLASISGNPSKYHSESECREK